MHDCQVGDKVLVLLLTMANKLLTQWQRPFEIVQQAGPMDYKVQHVGHKKRRQIYHVNLLKAWREPEGWMLSLEEPQEELGPEMGETTGGGEPRGKADVWCRTQRGTILPVTRAHGKVQRSI